MDVNMPIMGGLEASKKLRILQENNCIPKVPIMILTAGSPFTKNQMIENKIEKYLSKPVSKSALKKTLEEIWKIQL